MAAVQPSGPLEEVGPVSDLGNIEKAAEEKVDVGASTMKKSELEPASDLPVPLTAFPLLQPPLKDLEDTVMGLSAVMKAVGERQKMIFLFQMTQQMAEIADKLIKSYEEHRQAIQEEIKRIINSPKYQELQELKRKAPIKKELSDEAAAIALNVAVAKSDSTEPLHEDFTGIVGRLEKLAGANPEEDIISYSVLFTVAGGLALGAKEPKNEEVAAIEKLVQYLQPVLPEMNVQDMVPVINLMVMAPIFFRLLDEAISNFKNKGSKDNSELIQNFAKEVIKMVSDPTFALLTIVNNSEKVNGLTPEQKQNLIRILKLILASIALSLLYSLEVGKVKGEQFGGMEPQEFKALISGEIPIPKPKKEMTEQQRLTRTLTLQIRSLLEDIPAEVKQGVVEGLLEFLGQSQKVEKLINPAKVLIQAMQNMNFKIPIPKELYG